MIRKTVYSLLLIVFLSSASGYSLSLYYCGNTLISVAIGSKAESCCGDESGACCHNETRHYQIKDSYVAAPQDINEQNKSISDLIFFAASVVQPVINDIALTEIHFIAESPPPLSLNRHLSTIQTYLL